MDLDNTKRLKALTREDIHKAFIKTQENIKPPVGELVLVTEDFYDVAMEIPKTCFVDDEPLGKAMGLKWSSEFEDWWLATFKQNMSLMLRNPENGDVISLRAICIAHKSDNFDVNQFKDELLKDMLTFMLKGAEKASFFEKYSIEEAIHFLGLGVSKAYRKRGIGQFMMKAAMEFVSNLASSSYVIIGEGTSNYSKLIYEKLGFEIVCEIPYDTYILNGKCVLRGKTGEHKSMKEYGIKIDKVE